LACAAKGNAVLSTARSIVLLGVAATTVGLVAAGARLGAFAQEQERAGLRGSMAAPGAASVDGAGKSKDGKKTTKAPRKTTPITSKSVNAKLAGLTRAEVTKLVQAPVAVLSEHPPEARRIVKKRKIEDDLYTPLGLRLGGLTVLPAIEGDLGWDSNPNRQGGAHKGSPLARTEGEVKLQSDWGAHELKGALRGAYWDFRDAPSANRPEADGKLNLRLDASRDTAIELESRLRIDTERPGSVNLPASAANRALDISYGGSAGVTQKFNRLLVGLRGSVERFTYDDVRLGDGTTVSQKDRDYNQYGVRLRTGYELKPGLAPFVEVETDTRRHDQGIDRNGFARDSDGLTGRVGSTFEFTRLITGEMAAGYQVRRYDDPRLRDLRGPVLDGTLVWTPTPLTTVRFKASSRLDETVIVGGNGTLAQTIGIEVEHSLRRNLTLIAAATFSHSDYRGLTTTENGFAASLKIDYKLTRELVLRGTYAHERLDSSNPGSDYKANIFMVGLRLQR
jgi:hypothetical protein